MRDRVKLLVTQGADLHSPFSAPGGRPSWARTSDGLIATVLASDRRAVGRLLAYLETARAERGALIVWAAARGTLDAIVLLAEPGFDVNARGRTDIPMEQGWETALHEAAGQGNLQLARLLLDLGADPNIKRRPL
jgi:ankyrin repeat protein